VERLRQAGLRQKCIVASVARELIPFRTKPFGKDPFTGEDKWFAAKPASVRLKVRPLKKLKDAAL
jgi:hypothetical protein